MESMTDTRKVILLLKQVKEEKKLSLDAILALIEENGDYISKSTLSRIFKEGSEDQGFRYETTLRPIAEALLDIDNIEIDDDTDTKAYKAILHLKKDLITELKEELKAQESKLNDEKLKYSDMLQEETDKFQRSLVFMKHQIELKDQRIDALLSTTTELMTLNNSLVKQLMQCPLKKENQE